MMPHFLVVWCWCGHVGDVPVPQLAAFDRKAVLDRVRCSKCGARQVVRSSLVFTAGVNPYCPAEERDLSG